MRRVVWTQDALADRRAVFDWLAEVNPNAAVTQDELFEKAIRRLARFPESGRPGRVPGTRELVVSEHYVIPYRFEGGIVELLRVLHTSRLWPPGSDGSA